MEGDEPSSLLSFSTNHPLEQFVLLAKGAKGSACAELIKQVLEAPGVHVFGELLEMPNIKEVSHCKAYSDRKRSLGLIDACCRSHVDQLYSYELVRTRWH